MKKIALSILLLASVTAYAQLESTSKVYLQFSETEKEVNVNGNDALEMLESYVKNKTSLTIVTEIEASDYILDLAVYEKNLGNRMGQIAVLKSETKAVVFTSKWKKGTMNAFYGYSGTRHAIGRVFNGPFLKEFPSIIK